MDAVGADQHIAAHGLQLLAGRAIDEPGRHALLVLGEGIEGVTEEDILIADAGPHCLVQDHQQSTAMDRVLRPAVAGGEAARFAPDALPVLGVKRELGGRDRLAGELIAQTQLDQLAHGVRLDVDADADRTQLRHGLVDARLDARGVQGERGSQSADAAAHHDHPHPSLRALIAGVQARGRETRSR